MKRVEGKGRGWGVTQQDPSTHDWSFCHLRIRDEDGIGHLDLLDFLSRRSLHVFSVSREASNKVREENLTGEGC